MSVISYGSPISTLIPLGGIRNESTHIQQEQNPYLASPRSHDLFLSLGLWQHRQWLRQSGTQGRRQLDHHVHHLLHSLHTHGR